MLDQAEEPRKHQPVHENHPHSSDFFLGISLHNRDDQGIPLLSSIKYRILYDTLPVDTDDIKVQDLYRFKIYTRVNIEKHISNMARVQCSYIIYIEQQKHRSSIIRDDG